MNRSLSTSHSLPFIDSFTDYSSLGLLIANWSYPISCLKYLPDKVPIKFGAKGQVLQEGSKHIVLLSSFIGTAGLLYFALKARSPESTVYSLGVKPSKFLDMCRIARSFYIFNGFFLNLAVFGWNFMLIHGHKLDNEIRASWIKKGLIVLIATAVVGYCRYGYLLHRHVLST